MSGNYRGPSGWALVASAAAALGERSRYLEHMDTSDIAMDHEVVVIGAGFSGIGAAIKLDQAGFRDFVVLEAGRRCRRRLALEHLPRG